MKTLQECKSDIGVLIGLFLETKSLTCRPKTMALYQHILTTFARWLDQQPDPVLTPRVITAYLRSVHARGLREETLHNNYRQLKTLCRWLYDEGLIERDPFSGRGKVPTPARTRVYRAVYSDEAVARLLAAADAWHPTPNRYHGPGAGYLVREPLQAKALILLLCDSAMRIGEVARLTCGHLLEDELIIEGKGGHRDVVFISAPTRAALEALVEGRPPEAPLFRGRNNGEPATPHVLRGIIERLAVRADVELPPRCVHAFRHYACRRWLRAGASTLAIKGLMRHQTISTTEIYAQIDTATLQRIHQQVTPIADLLALAEAEARSLHHDLAED